MGDKPNSTPSTEQRRAHWKRVHDQLDQKSMQMTRQSSIAVQRSRALLERTKAQTGIKYIDATQRPK